MTPTELRDSIAYLDAHLDEMGTRSLTPDEQTSFDEGLALREQYAADLIRHEALAKRAKVPGFIDGGPSVITQRTALEVAEDRDAKPSDLIDAATRCLEERGVDAENMDHVRGVLKRHGSNREWARNILLRSTPEYTERFFDAIRAAEDETRTVLGITTNANGKYLLPTHLDPTIILTNAGSNNVIRQIARKTTLTVGNVWNGVTSAGVTASWDGEVVEVSDDTPTVGRVSVTVNRAQAFVQASLSAAEDIAGLSDDVLMLLQDARDRLEGAAFCTGSGSSNQPRGIFTALNANGSQQVTSATAAAIALGDIHNTYKLPLQRFRGNGSWVMNPVYALAVKALGTAVSASFTTDLTQAPSDRILGRPAYETDDAPSTQTTTTLDNEIVYGDFSNYLIVDKPGSMAIQYIPTLFNTANNLPDGRVGWFATWRVGADSINDAAFALLVDKTSA